jgi:glycosyl-4,4'-diaponeurosporenoate acyltransferase
VPDSTGVTVLLDAAAWAVLSTAVGLGINRLHHRRFEADGPLTRLRAFEEDGRVYDRWLRIRRWKDRVPEAGAWGVGFAKGHLPSRDRAGLERFAAETRRAEVVHWVLLACGPLFLAWNRGGLAAAMIAYAVVANVPCILIQRYNRGRLQRLLATRAGRRHPPPRGDG